MEQSIQQLAKDLSLKLEALEEGMLSLEDLAPLVDEAREVYERLIALRYAAIEKVAKQGDAVRDQDDQGNHEPQPFRITNELPGQTSLIDAIEEIQQAETPTVKPDEEDDPSPLFEESEPVDEPQASEGVKPPHPEKTEAPAPSTLEPSKASEPVVAASQESQKKEKTIADRLRKTPIEDLRKAIGINQRFQFLNELFAGDNALYMRTIDEVNSAESVSSAMHILGKASERLAAPDEEDAVAQALLQLVERRFL